MATQINMLTSYSSLLKETFVIVIPCSSHDKILFPRLKTVKRFWGSKHCLRPVQSDNSAKKLSCCIGRKEKYLSIGLQSYLQVVVEILSFRPPFIRSKTTNVHAVINKRKHCDFKLKTNMSVCEIKSLARCARLNECCDWVV